MRCGTITVPVPEETQGFIYFRRVKMVTEKKEINNTSMETFTVCITRPMLYDRLHMLSAEYSVSVEFLVNTAVKRLIDDVDFVRDMRTGMAGGK